MLLHTTSVHTCAYDECPNVQYDETAAGTFRGSVFPEKASVVRSPTFILFRRDKGAGTDWSCRRAWAAARAMPSRPASTVRPGGVRPTLPRPSPSPTTGCPPIGSPSSTRRATAGGSKAATAAGGELRFANGVALLAKFDGEFASRSNTYAGTGTIRYRW